MYRAWYNVIEIRKRATPCFNNHVVANVLSPTIVRTHHLIAGSKPAVALAKPPFARAVLLLQQMVTLHKIRFSGKSFTLFRLEGESWQVWPGG